MAFYGVFKKKGVAVPFLFLYWKETYSCKEMTYFLLILGTWLYPFMQFSPDSGITYTSFPAEAIADSHQNSSQTRVNIKGRAKTHSILSRT